MSGQEITHKEIEFMAGSDLSNAVDLLLEHKNRGELVCGVFNGQPLYSDSITEDVAYMLVMNDTKDAYEEKVRRDAEEAERQHQKHMETIPEQTKEWITKGMNVLEFDKWDYWAKIVPIRLKDLYQGMELGNTLDLIKLLQENRYEEANNLMHEQGHSGMSYSLVKQMVIEFDSRGQYFVDNYLEKDDGS